MNMSDLNFTASKMFNSANRFVEAYHAALQPICRDTGLPPMAVDILMEDDPVLYLRADAFCYSPCHLFEKTKARSEKGYPDRLVCCVLLRIGFANRHSSLQFRNKQLDRQTVFGCVFDQRQRIGQSDPVQVDHRAIQGQE